jgi:hypothetical protein
MTYFVVQDFKGGLNANKLAVTATPGTLRRLHNAHITRGGEIEKRKAFVPYRTMPAGETFGLGALGSSVYTFGIAASPTVPAPIQYQRLLDPPAGKIILRVLSVQTFAGKFYVIVQWDDGSISHYYDGARVTDFSIDAAAESARIALPFGSKMYVASGPVLYAGEVEQIGFGASEPGVGAYDMSTRAAGAETITGLGEYQELMAVFSRRVTQLWSFASDPDAAQRVQTIPRVGTIAARSVVSFAGTDVFFLADSGVRSLRARSGVTTAAAADVGTPIDDIVVERVRQMTQAQYDAIFGEIEPTSGRYWLTVGDETYVFSYFPGSQVSAWSTYTLPAGSSWMAVLADRAFVRAGDVVYLYGGENAETYDESQAEVTMPFLDGRASATWKSWRGLDIAAEGDWEVYASMDPEQPDSEDLISTLSGSTFYQLDQVLYGFGPLMKLRFVSVGSGPARLGSVAIHYETAAAK